MQAAAEATPSGMAALIGLKLDAALAACDGTGAQVANANSEEQIVIAGPSAALEAAIERAKAAGARRALPLEVAGAFHTEVMRPAQIERPRTRHRARDLVPRRNGRRKVGQRQHVVGRNRKERPCQGGQDPDRFHHGLKFTSSGA